MVGNEFFNVLVANLTMRELIEEFHLFGMQKIKAGWEALVSERCETLCSTLGEYIGLKFNATPLGW